MIELRIVVCLVTRSFKTCAVYDELDAEADRSGNKTKERKLKVFDGERSYQVGNGEPRELLLCRVNKTKEKGDSEHILG